ncbi:MAG: PKD domain-containing protein [Bacteroidales bacterium]|nr:PKD domain-containing protein [Bacteroidales bacterium]
MKNGTTQLRKFRMPLLVMMLTMLWLLPLTAQEPGVNQNGYPVRIHKKEIPSQKTNDPRDIIRAGRLAEISEMLKAESSHSDMEEGATILVADLSPLHNSGPQIYQIISNLGYSVQYTTLLPSNTQDFGAVFVCLGMFPDNYVLSDPEGIILVNYLNAGGHLFMEGGDTWFWDYPTPVHAMFNILGVEEAFWYDILELIGQSGTLTENMLFGYDNAAYNWGPDFDHISAISPADDIFFHSDPVFGCGVSYDEGSYKTVGLAFEIGGMLEMATSKQELVSSILQFFGQPSNADLVEDFETGDFSKFPWTMGGNAPWIITQADPHQGVYSAKSGFTGNNETSEITVMLENQNPGEVSFYFKVSSETFYDKLTFIIDNMIMESWSGEIDWTSASYSVGPGTHIYQWSYEKDFSVVMGEDCAWLDYIVFPGAGTSIAAGFTGAPTLLCEGEMTQFTDNSSGNIISWEWQFPGGNPPYSTMQNPAIQYSNFGSFDVTLTVSDGVSTSSITKQDYIKVEECTGGTILVADLDLSPGSGIMIQEAIENAGHQVDYKLALPPSLGQYSAAFVCLGIWPANHVLTPVEGQLLADFLALGGKLYMEGGDTWAWDSPTPVHPMFSIDPIADGNYGPVLQNIAGQPATFTEGMFFLYNGEDKYIDHIGPLGSSFLVLENHGPEIFGCAVAYDESTYKTIGASVEFGGMSFGPTPKEEVMAEYLTFFGLQGGGTNPAIEDFETGDFSKFNWQFGGMSDWMIETLDPWEGLYCARSGQIENNEFTELIIQVEVQEQNTISFYSSISTEANYDEFSFFIDNALIEKWSGEIGWMFHEYPVATGMHTFKWVYNKDASVALGDDCTRLDYIKLPTGGTPPPPPVDEDFETGDFSKFDWMFTGNIPWMIDDMNPSQGNYCAKSGLVADGASTGLSLELNILEAGNISFYRQVSSENFFDKFFFFIDGIEIENWSGEIPWGQVSYPVDPGVHTFTWQYTKDYAVAMGEDCARIDDITFPPFEIPCPPVVAGFTHSLSNIDPFTVFFVSVSQGNISDWIWNFGDGGVSGLENPVHTYQSPGIYNVCLTVVNACNGNTDTFCDVVEIEDPCPPCIAYFTYIQDPGDPFTFFFNDASQGLIAGWHWDFGDGNTSTQQFPVHTYGSEGVYSVCLTVISACSYCMDTFCETITIDVPNHYNLGGTVFAGNFPIDEGFAYLYRIENGQIVDVFASFIHEYGYYDFFQLEEGAYILKAELSPNSPNYNLYIPTYYVSVPNWVNANIINLQSNIWNADVHMIPISGAQPGTGLIAGSIYKSAYKSGDLGPVYNVEILLMDETDNLFTCTYTGNDGYFEFPQIAYGTYKVYAEITGKYCIPAIITISEDHPEVTGISFFIDGDQISLSIKDHVAEGISMGDLYPNPAEESVYINFNLNRPGEFNVAVFDQNGRQVYTSHHSPDKGNYRLEVPVDEFVSGLYTLKVSASDGSFAVRRFIKR